MEQIELDGGIHETQKDYDEAREYVLKSLGIKIIRFKNEIIMNDIEKTINIIRQHLNTSHPSLSKRGGPVKHQRVSL